MLLNDGSTSSKVSRGENKRKMNGLAKANKTVAAAFIPGVLENMSTDNPKKNPHNINSLRETPVSNFSIK